MISQMQQLRVWLLIVSAVGSCLISACGASSTNVPVTGKVVVKGSVPLGEGQLVLIPDPADPKRANCSATIRTDGSFSCVATAGGEGIPPGKYKVVLSFSSGKGNVNPFISAFKKYTQPDSTPLKLDVTSAGVKDHVFELEEPPVIEDKKDQPEPSK